MKPGDRVLCTEVRQGCGHCYQCLHDRHWFCENLPPMSFRLPSPFVRLNGERCTQTCSGASGFAEYTNAHEAMLCKLDDDIPFEIGSALACGFMSGFGAVLNRCKIKPGESFAVVGCGGVGLSASWPPVFPAPFRSSAWIRSPKSWRPPRSSAPPTW